MVDVHATCITFESLPRQPPEQGTTVLTEGWTLVVVDFESVWHVDLESLLMEHGFSAIDCGSCALGYHFINALLVNRCITVGTGNPACSGPRQIHGRQSKMWVEGKRWP